MSALAVAPRQVAATELSPLPEAFTLRIERQGRALGLQLRGLQVVPRLYEAFYVCYIELYTI